uniref:Integrin alpha-8 n=2 Tax=Aceria tosichella TaxID=561515 RepID=A0A6G1SR37_9ACAR
MFLFPATTLSLLLASLLLSGQQQQQLRPAQAFNIDTQSAIVHSGPEGSYFGYTVAQHRDRNQHWLLVGAPKAQTSQPRVERGGAVYRCSPTPSKACQQIPFDPNGHSMISVGNSSVQNDDKSRQWFGGSLQSSSDNGSIIACAPRYVYYTANLRRRDPVGSCWISRGSFAGFLEYSPCRINDQYGHHHLGSCQAGFASAITKDGGKIFMAAPGAHVWQGQVFEHNLRTDLSKSTSPVNPHYEDDSYLGYSLALGRFSSHSSSSPTGSSEVDVAIGMPRGNELAGKIVIADRDLRTMVNITGEQLGAYFGYALATADINGDKLDDLIIGAPLFYNQTISHKEPHFERGRVYVALQNNRHEFHLVQRIDGQKNRARFGTSIANCGDLNRDGYQDVAIGAPYDGPEHRGAVYIYMGRKQGGLSDDYDQVIYAESIKPEGHLLRSFGFSLSGGLDIDGNQYPDLLVGDYMADRAILLKARPVVNVTATLSFQPENFNLDDKTCSLPNSSTSVPCITVQYCTKYTGLNVDQSLGFVYDIRLDTENKGAPRLFFLEKEGKNEDRISVILNKDEPKCRSFKAYIMRQIRDKLTPLRVDIDYALAEYSGETYDYVTGQAKLRPVLNRSGQPNRLSKIATIQKNCGPDNVCVPDLKLTVTPNLDSYTIGNNEKLVLDVTVKNYGEDAFESMFYLTMPMTINFITINKTRSDYPICYGAKPDQMGVNVLSCDLGNPQVRNDVVKFSVITEPARGGQFTSPDFTFHAQVNSTNPELDDKHREDNQLAIGIPIRVEFQLVLSGSSQPPQVLHNTTLLQQEYQQQHQQQPDNSLIRAPRVNETQIGPEVWHVYQLQNKGPSNINDIALTILWPSKTKDGDPLLYLVDEPQTNDKARCKPAPSDSINPLNLKYVRGNPNTVTGQQQSQHNNLVIINQNQRQKRQTNLIGMESAPAQRSSSSSQPVAGEAMAQTITTTVDNSILEQLDMQSGGNSARWTLFECNVYDLGHNEIATIKIRSRLDEETISKLSLQDFDISSKMIAQVKSLPYNTSLQTMPPYVYKVETRVHTTGMSLQDRLPWWLIILAILLGTLLFALLACFLRYLGFFTRKRPPKTAEREPLTPTIWNDYQYTPGDTAL